MYLLYFFLKIKKNKKKIEKLFGVHRTGQHLITSPATSSPVVEWLWDYILWHFTYPFKALSSAY